MEFASRNLQKCHICDRTIFSSGKDIFTARTDHTDAIIHEILEQFVGHDLSRSNRNLICLECFSRLNDYDLACLTAQEVQKELTDMLNATYEKYEDNIEQFPFVEADIIEEDGNEEEMSMAEVEVAEPLALTGMKCEEVIGVKGIDNETDDYELHLYSREDFVNEDESVEPAEYIYEVLSEQEDDVKNVLEADAERIAKIALNSAMAAGDFYCKRCSVQFECEEELREHRNAHPKSNLHMLHKTIYTCELCGQTYKTRTAFNRHTAMHTGGDTDSPYKCEICGKCFSQKGALKRHQPIHTGERRFQCERCGKQFIHYSSFHMHNLAHDDIRDKKCEICGIMLRSSSHLRRHMLVHTGAKPHMCPKCGKSFAQRYNMMSHFRSHQGISRKKKFACDICRRSFAKEEMLQKHIEGDECDGSVFTKTEIVELNQSIDT